MLNSSEPQSADLLQITVCLRHWAFEEGIYDLIKSISSPGNKTRTKGSSSCRTKLLSCHHGRTELFFPSIVLGKNQWTNASGTLNSTGLSVFWPRQYNHREFDGPQEAGI